MSEGVSTVHSAPLNLTSSRVLKLVGRGAQTNAPNELCQGYPYGRHATPTRDSPSHTYSTSQYGTNKPPRPKCQTTAAHAVAASRGTPHAAQRRQTRYHTYPTVPSRSGRRLDSDRPEWTPRSRTVADWAVGPIALGRRCDRRRETCRPPPALARLLVVARLPRDAAAEGRVARVAHEVGKVAGAVPP